MPTYIEDSLEALEARHNAQSQAIIKLRKLKTENGLYKAATVTAQKAEIEGLLDTSGDPDLKGFTATNRPA
jgi:hypothetical protein